MDKNQKDNFKKELLSKLKSIESHDGVTKPDYQLVVKILAKFIQDQFEFYPENMVLREMKFLLHPDKINKLDKLKDLKELQESLIDINDTPSGLFGAFSTACIYNSFDNEDIDGEQGDVFWRKLLNHLKGQLNLEENQIARQIIEAQIYLIKLVLRFETGSEENIGELYNKVLDFIPVATAMATASMAPLMTSFIILNNIVQQMIYYNEYPETNIWRALRPTLLSMSSVVATSGNLAVIGLCYINIYLADGVMSVIKNMYNNLYHSNLGGRSASRALIQYPKVDNVNINWRMIFQTQAFTLIAGIILDYIDKQNKPLIPSLWTGKVKADILQGYLITLSKIDRSDESLLQKLINAENSFGKEIKYNKILNGSGKEATIVINQVSEILESSIKTYNDPEQINQNGEQDSPTY